MRNDQPEMFPFLPKAPPSILLPPRQLLVGSSSSRDTSTASGLVGMFPVDSSAWPPLRTSLHHRWSLAGPVLRTHPFARGQAHRHVSWRWLRWVVSRMERVVVEGREDRRKGGRHCVGLWRGRRGRDGWCRLRISAGAHLYVHITARVGTLVAGFRLV